LCNVQQLCVRLLYVGMGDVTSLLAVLNRDWTDVNIRIVDGIWFG